MRKKLFCSYSDRRALEGNRDIDVLKSHAKDAELLSNGGFACFSEHVAALDRPCVTLLCGDREGKGNGNDDFKEHV